MNGSDSMLPNGKPMPTFQPWLGRVRAVRTWSAVVGFLAVTAVSHSSARGWDIAMLHGFVGAAVLYFVAWASALLLFGELYNVQVAHVRAELEAREADRRSLLQRRYDDRVRELHGIPTGGPIDGLNLSTAAASTPGNIPTSGIAPPAREAA